MKDKHWEKLIIILIFSITVAACSNPTGDDGGETDTWSDVTNLEQIDGTWKSIYIQNMTIREAIEFAGMEWDPGMQLLLGDMKANSATDVTLTIDAAAKTQATSAISVLAFSGGTVAFVWPLYIKPALEDLEEEGVTITINDDNYSVTMEYDNPPQTLSDDDIAEILNSGLQISQDGTKMRVPAGTLREGTPELIFYKQ
jgi:hypothetical protein